MTNNEAHQILDRVKNGIFEPNKRVTEALLTLGDLQPNRFTDHDFGTESVYCRSRSLESEAAIRGSIRSIYEHKPRCEGED